MSAPTLSPTQLQHAMQCAAECDAAINPEDWLRAFQYEENWSDGIVMARYDNGAGDHVIAFFSADGQTLIKGFDHESEVSPHARDVYGIWPGIYDGLPPKLSRLVQDEASEYEHVTFCYWSLDGETWHSGNAVIPENIDDGSTWLLSMVELDAEKFTQWAKDYYEEDFASIGESGVAAMFKK